MKTDETTAEPLDIPGYETVAYKNILIPVKQIEAPEYALRGAQTEDPKFKDLMGSIAKIGLLHNLVVRELAGSTPESPRYGVIDGLQRYTALKMMDYPEPVPCRVVEMDDAEVAQTQLIANCVKIETKPIEYTVQIRRILNSNPTLSRAQLADELNVSEKFLNDRLSLHNLCEAAKLLVADGALKLNHAFTLAKLQPPQEQESFLAEAQNDVYPEFAAKVEARLSEIRKAAQAGRKTGERQHVAVPVLRKVKEFEVALADDSIVNELLARENPATLAEAVKVGMKWGVQLDPASVQAKKEKDERIRLEREVESAHRQEEQAKSRAAKALERAQQLSSVEA